MGVASLVMGILALVICWIPCLSDWAILFAILGIIFGAVGIVKAKKTNKGKGLSIAGLVCSIVATTVVVLWVFVIAAAKEAANINDKELNEAMKALQSL
jgi:hypothetical protein